MAKISPLMLAPPMIFFAFASMALVGMFRDDPDALPSAREGQPAPPVVLSALGDKSGFDDAALRGPGEAGQLLGQLVCAMPGRTSQPRAVGR